MAAEAVGRGASSLHHAAEQRDEHFLIKLSANRTYDSFSNNF